MENIWNCTKIGGLYKQVVFIYRWSREAGLTVQPITHTYAEIYKAKLKLQYDILFNTFNVSRKKYFSSNTIFYRTSMLK